MITGTWQTPTDEELLRIREMMEDAQFYDAIARVPDDALSAALAGSKDTALWVFRVDQKAVAYVYMTEMATSLPKVDEFGVFERGQGFGKAALSSLAAKIAQTPDYEKLWLNVVDGNDNALNLYRKVGFGEEKFIAKGWKTRSGRVVDQVRMWLTLDTLRGQAS
ncbi:GNAT family N-acetyltransferase [Thalassospira sp. CH_XMU1458]|uniref:GNAT family N-acetyltransferase n=1 Tax=Thalassospira sp. CH_XMU1458 TaxID=3107776 RepID=UPI00300D1654